MLKIVTDLIGGIGEVVFSIVEVVACIAIYLFMLAAVLACLRWFLGIGA